MVTIADPQASALTLYGQRDGRWVGLGGRYLNDRVGMVQMRRDANAVRDLGFTAYEARRA